MIANIISLWMSSKESVKEIKIKSMPMTTHVKTSVRHLNVRTVPILLLLKTIWDSA